MASLTELILRMQSSSLQICLIVYCSLYVLGYFWKVLCLNASYVINEYASTVIIALLNIFFFASCEVHVDNNWKFFPVVLF